MCLYLEGRGEKQSNYFWGQSAMPYQGNLVKILLRGLREADEIFFLTQESQIVSGGKHPEQQNNNLILWRLRV